MRGQYHETQEELQLIASQKILLVASPAAPPPPMDLAQCVEAMRGDLGQMFDDPRLSAEARAKKMEVEAGFIAFRNIFAILSPVKMEYDAACTGTAEASRTTEGSNGHPPADPKTGGG